MSKPAARVMSEVVDSASVVDESSGSFLFTF